jgi:hypothetical protein
MAGPTAVVVSSGDSAAADAEAFIRNLGKLRTNEDIILVSDTRSVGGRYVGEPRPFVLGVVTFGGDEAEYSQLEKLLHGVITCAVEVGAMANREIDYVVLADIVAALACNLDGVAILTQEIGVTPTSGIALNVTTAEGYRYTVVDAKALRELIERRVTLFVK